MDTGNKITRVKSGNEKTESNRRMGEKIKKLLSANKKKTCGIAAAVILLAGAITGAVVLYGGSEEPYVAKANQAPKENAVIAKSDMQKTGKTDEKKKPEAIKKEKAKEEADKKKTEEPTKPTNPVRPEKAVKPQDNIKTPGKEKGENVAANVNTSPAQQQEVQKEGSAPTQEQTDMAQGNTGVNNGGNGSNVSSGTAEQPKEPKPVWHDPIYEDKWVVDKAAWDETISEPIYETQEIAIGNQSGTIISGDPNAYLLDNPNGDTGWHSELQQVQTGTNTYTVHHDEVGHWEKALVKDGYWK